MRKIVAGFASSVDGYIEGPEGEYDWILIDKEINFSELMKRFDTYFLGRKTYQMTLLMGSKKMPGIANYVFSNTLKAVDKNYILITDNIKDQVNLIKKQKGKDIAIFGGANLLASLLNLQLVDEITISIIPVLLGKGKPMIDVLTEKIWLSFVSSKSYPNGTLQVNYAVTYSNK